MTPGDEPDCYLITPVAGEPFEISLSVPGLDIPAGETWSACGSGDYSDLVVTRIDDPDQHNELVVVPLDGPSRIAGVRAFMSGDLFLVTIQMSHECHDRPGEIRESRWVVVEMGSEIRVLQNSAVTHGGECDQHSMRTPLLMIKPQWHVRNDELWMRLPVESFLCYSDAEENRGVIEWQVGEAPQPVQFLFPEKLQVLVAEVQALGYQPYTHFPLGRGRVGMLAEVPTSMGSRRLLAVADRKGRNALVYLPQFGYQYEPIREGSPVDRSEAARERLKSHTSWLQKQWPQLRTVEAFEYSESFRSARPGPSIRTLLHDRKVSILEFLPARLRSRKTPFGFPTLRRSSTSSDWRVTSTCSA